MRIIHTALVVLFAAAIVIFCVQTLDSVPVRYLGWKANIPMPILVPLVYVLGMLTGWSVLSFLRRSIQGARKKPD